MLLLSRSRPARIQTPGKRLRRRRLPVAVDAFVLKSHGPKSNRRPLSPSTCSRPLLSRRRVLPSPPLPSPPHSRPYTYIKAPSRALPSPWFPQNRRCSLGMPCALPSFLPHSLPPPSLSPRLSHSLLTAPQPLPVVAETWPNSRLIASSAGCLAIVIHGGAWRPKYAPHATQHQCAFTPSSLETIAPKRTMQLSRRQSRTVWM